MKYDQNNNANITKTGEKVGKTDIEEGFLLLPEQCLTQKDGKNTYSFQ